MTSFNNIIIPLRADFKKVKRILRLRIFFFFFLLPLLCFKTLLL